MMHRSILTIILLTLLVSCKPVSDSKSISEDDWRLGWRMIENTWNDKYQLAESQFDSLLNSESQLQDIFIVSGLEIKAKLLKEDEVSSLMSIQSTTTLSKICRESFASEFELCKELPEEKVENKELQLRIIKLFVQDQAIRGNMMHGIIDEYDVDTTGIITEQDWSNQDEVNVDEVTRNELKLVIKEYGFPTQKLIGQEAMRGVFIIIQHADGDVEWQKLQLLNLENAAMKGDLSKLNYAFLYDRIQVNEGLPQRYGSQFGSVNKAKGVAKLRETELMEDLDIRRREMGMMPIETYRRRILRE